MFIPLSEQEFDNLYLRDLFDFKLLNDSEKDLKIYEELELLGKIEINIMLDIRNGINYEELNMKIKPLLEKQLNEFTLKYVLKNGKRYCRFKRHQKKHNGKIHLRKNTKNVYIKNYDIIHKIKDIKGVQVPINLQYYIEFGQNIKLNGFNIQFISLLYKNKNKKIKD